MVVAELIAKLSELPADAPVLLSARNGDHYNVMENLDVEAVRGFNLFRGGMRKRPRRLGELLRCISVPSSSGMQTTGTVSPEKRSRRLSCRGRSLSCRRSQSTPTPEAIGSSDEVRLPALGNGEDELVLDRTVVRVQTHRSETAKRGHELRTHGLSYFALSARSYL